MSILDIERLVMAGCQPITGDRATGAVVLKSATVANVSVPHGRTLFPIVNGKTIYEMPFKVAFNDATRELTGAARGAWTVPQVGAAVSIVSNIGGARHNLPKGTRFLVDQPLKPELLPNPQTPSGTTGATDPDGDLALFNFISYETFGPQASLDLFRSGIGGRFPAAIIAWVESEPADGLTSSAVSRPTHRGQVESSYSELFEIRIISSRADSKDERRGQGLRILDELTFLLIDKQAIDNQPLSSPGGIHVRRRFHERGSDSPFYQVFQVYTVSLTVQTTYEKRQRVDYDLLRKFKINAPREDTPTDLPLVVDNLVDNPQT